MFQLSGNGQALRENLRRDESLLQQLQKELSKKGPLCPWMMWQKVEGGRLRAS